MTRLRPAPRSRSARMALTAALMAVCAQSVCAAPAIKPRNRDSSFHYDAEMKTYFVPRGQDENSSWTVFGQPLDAATLESETPIAFPGLGERGKIVTPAATIVLDRDFQKFISSDGKNPTSRRNTAPPEDVRRGANSDQGQNVSISFSGLGNTEKVWTIHLNHQSNAMISDILFLLPAVPDGQSELDPALNLAISKQIPYFERDADGSFTLRNANAGDELRFAITGGMTPNKYAMQWTKTFKVAKTRAAITGVDLDVGMPEIETRTEERAVEIPAQQWSCIVARVGDTGHLVTIVYIKKRLGA